MFAVASWVIFHQYVFLFGRRYRGRRSSTTYDGDFQLCTGYCTLSALNKRKSLYWYSILCCCTDTVQPFPFIECRQCTVHSILPLYWYCTAISVYWVQAMYSTQYTAAVLVLYWNFRLLSADNVHSILPLYCDFRLWSQFCILYCCTLCCTMMCSAVQSVQYSTGGSVTTARGL
jgi:hypothetical protein